VVMISEAAQIALEGMEAGRGAIMDRGIGRELIDAGFVRDFFGSLEITEAGRMKVRRGVSYEVDDPNVANLRPIDRVAKPWWVNRAAPVAQSPDGMIGGPYADAGPRPDPELVAPSVTERVPLWNRSRAQRAAGQANGSTGVWVSPEWVLAFMDAYEQDGVS